MLVTALSTVHQWVPLGIYLGLSDSTLKDIFFRNQEGNDETHVSEMLAMWLKGPEKKRTKQFLQRTLLRLTPQPVLLPDTSGEQRKCHGRITVSVFMFIAQQTSDSMLPSSITSLSHSNTTGTL